MSNDIKKTLEEMKNKANEEFSVEIENPVPPEVVERVNQILNDAIASLPPEPIEPAPEVDAMEKVRKQIADALAQMNASPEVTSKVTGVVGGSTAPAPWTKEKA